MSLITKLTELYKKTPHHLKIASVAWLTRIITAGIQVLSIRILISYLGTDIYAGFAILTSLAGWFALSEFGLGATLQNFASEYRVKNENIQNLFNAAIPSILFLLLISSLFLTIMSVPLQIFLFKSLSSSLSSQPLFIVWMIGFFYIITSLSSIAYRIYYAEQRGYLANIYPAIGSIITFILLLFIDYLNIYKGSLSLALIVFILPTTLVALYAFYDVFIHDKNITLKNFDFKILKLIFLRAYKFAGFAFMGATVLQIDYIVMSRVLNPIDITIYNIISKVFFLIYFVYTAVLMALWPVCTELQTNREWESINKLLRKHLLSGVIIVVIGTIALIFTKDIISNLLASGKNLFLPAGTIILFGVYYSLRVWADTFAVMLQSASNLKIFWIYIPFQGLISFLGQYFLGRNFGLNGIVMGLILSFLLTAAWVLPFGYYKIIRE